MKLQPQAQSICTFSFTQNRRFAFQHWRTDSLLHILIKLTENRDYLRKEGKWQGSDKEQTNLIDTFEEVGNVPKSVDENSPDMSALIEEIENGLDTYEFIKLHPKYAFRIKEIDTLRQTVL